MRYHFILFIFCYMWYIWSIYNFCETYLDKCKMNKRVFAFILFSAGMFVNALNEWASIPYIFTVMLSYLLWMGLFFAAFQDNIKKKIFIALFLIALKDLIWNFGCSFLSCLFLVFANMFTGGQITSIHLIMENMIGAAAYCMAALALNILKEKLINVFHNKIQSWYSMLSLPLFLIILIVDTVNWGASNGILVVSNSNGAEYWNVFYNQVLSHTAICLLTMLAFCIVIGLVFGLHKIYVEQSQKEQYISQIEFYKMLNIQYLQMEQLRHDMKNHVLALHGLWENGEFIKLGSYLKKMLDRGSIGKNNEVTGNNAIDALLYHKGKKAEQNQIRWECDVQIPNNCKIDEFDLCVLFGNILDNALNGYTKIKNTNIEGNFVRIQAGPVKKYFLLVVKNATAMKNIKEMKQGIGFLNINETVKKYNGVINTKVENNVFEVSILLPMNGN